jgi:hypothetical protein
VVDLRQLVLDRLEAVAADAIAFIAAHTSETGVLAGNPVTFSDAFVLTGPCVGVIFAAAPFTPVEAGTGCG